MLARRRARPSGALPRQNPKRFETPSFLSGDAALEDEAGVVAGVDAGRLETRMGVLRGCGGGWGQTSSSP
ncbi:hypothetical protein HUA74_23100 [Myxococcus sp. CA051A]|uniref:hypothetical protein n=1 Tax=unclassified Myxococcus TaxID=2648731 RepID=UPI00157A984B|nr:MULTISPECIES: hypothetical protein [unclassified Myxococcus]NTX17032.1 hypothetical protein [Myxococcus sp. CA056]NTX35817.1 hypothetical protein [Myxococcus sp. CA033]NTX63546.1 hypothetical protein [Myxococcus sp. CA051A]